MHRYTATLANEPNNPWRWTGDAHHLRDAAIQAAHWVFANAHHDLEPEDVYPMNLDIAYAETPDKPLATVRVSQQERFATEIFYRAASASIRGG